MCLFLRILDRSVEESTANESDAEADTSQSANETVRIGLELLRKVEVMIENQRALIVGLNSVAEFLKSAFSK